MGRMEELSFFRLKSVSAMVTPFLICSLLVLACVVHPLYSAKESCSDRCGESYHRRHSCHCDYGCLIHNECCKDYESMCTTSDSCKGRCGETFKRGRPCTCDLDCTLYNQCCPDYQMHCGTEPQTSKLINKVDVTVAHTQSSPGENEDINQDLSDDHLIPLSTPPSPMLPADEIQGDEGIGPTPYQVPVPAFEGVGPTATLYPDSMSGQEPLVISTTEDMLSSSGAYTPLHSTAMPTLWSEPEAINEEISTLFPEDLLLTRSSTVTPPVTDGTDVSTSVPSSEPPVEITSVPNSSSAAPELQSDSATNWSPITVSELTNPSATPTREHDVISPESTEPTTRIPQEPQATATTSEAGTAATPGTAEYSPSASQSSDQPVPTNKPKLGPTDSGPSTSRDETPAVTPVPSPSPEADGVKGAGDASREHDVISPESTEPTTQIPQEPQATATTPEAGTAATPGTAEYSPSASQSSDQPVPTNKPTLGLTDSGPSTSRDKTPAVTPVPSPSPEADGVKGAGDASSTSPSGTPDQSGTSVTPPLTGTAAQTDSSSPATATGADTSLAGDDITNAAQTEGPTPTDEAQNIETQPAPSSDPTTAPMRPNPSPSQPSKSPIRPSTLTVIAQTLATHNPNLPEDNNDTNLCSGRPISGLTTLQNGTVVVFRGNYFWVLDANRSPGPAHGITDTWGIPSPIDTVFTRCHCEGKTYFMKGNNYWRFGNDVMDQGYPKSIYVGFDKLAGKITAALSVPATRKRRESVYFFKRGGLVQKYTYKPNSACSRRVPKKVYLVRTRFTRQTASAEPGLGKEINIKLKWRGFPTLVTSAVSIPSPRQPDGYNYYIFSRTKYYKIKLDNEQPALANPSTVPSQGNSANNWFKCP
ncbi:hypothetical protein SKAU_G00067120 [Synaphobranchus kaupii]|uniref:SMB domain-containing protein n=1 Tax=Synaphobranchus kaupii TaxID=118154 RepID=A0A9Q1G629_SYNKA|nr:hypothetical protein SKAU_G00067120 [Synaphobranchus kaupii]